MPIHSFPRRTFLAATSAALLTGVPARASGVAPPRTLPGGAPPPEDEPPAPAAGGGKTMTVGQRRGTR